MADVTRVLKILALCSDGWRLDGGGEYWQERTGSTKSQGPDTTTALREWVEDWLSIRESTVQQSGTQTRPVRCTANNRSCSRETRKRGFKRKSEQ